MRKFIIACGPQGLGHRRIDASHRSSDNDWLWKVFCSGCDSTDTVYRIDQVRSQGVQHWYVKCNHALHALLSTFRAKAADWHAVVSKRS